MTEITDLSTTDSSNTSISGESLDGAIANMGRMDNTLQATMGMLARSIRTNVLRWIDGTDSTKRVALDLSGLPTATTRTLGAPYYSGTLGLVSDIRGQIYGLTLSNNVTDATNDIDIAAGSAVDSTGAVSMQLLAGMTKRADAVWTAGTNQGGRFYATLADGTIHFYVIRNPTTGVVDAGFSDNATNPTGGASYPSGFTQYRRVGSFLRVSGSIRAFKQLGDKFLWDVAANITGITNPGTSALTRTLPVPSGIQLDALLTVSLVQRSTIANAVLVSSLEISDQGPSVTTATTLSIVGGNTLGSGFRTSGDVTVRTNTSGQVRIRAQASDADTEIYLLINGWVDSRGQYA